VDSSQQSLVSEEIDLTGMYCLSLGSYQLSRSWGASMGVVQRSLHKKANQRVAASRVLEVSCALPALPEAIQRLFDAWNSASDNKFEASLSTKGRMSRWAANNSSPNTRHYFLLEQAGQLIATFGVRAAFVAERGLKNHGEGWIAQITPVGGGGEGTTHINVVLLRWSVDDGGRIWNGGRYVQMLDGLIEGLNGSYVSEPVSQEDCNFVSRA
jgi:hypothetical protein